MGAGRLAAATADVTRLRLALEGSWEASLWTGSSLRPAFEVGLRHDGGDAETGFGLEIGGGLALTDPVLGLSAEIRGHGLLTHREDGFRDHGVSGALRYDPQPWSELGLSLSVSPSWGVGQRGVESLWGAAPTADAGAWELRQLRNIRRSAGSLGRGDRVRNTGSRRHGYGDAVGPESGLPRSSETTVWAIALV